MTIVLQIAVLGTSNASAMVQEGDSVNAVEAHTSTLERPMVETLELSYPAVVESHRPARSEPWMRHNALRLY